jgi:hypothetical protein
MAAYNGHRSWNAYNVSLWINNDEPLYSRAWELAQKYGHIKAARFLNHELKGQRTPDGAKYNFTCIKEALRDMVL